MSFRSLDNDLQALVKAMIETLENARQDAYDLAKEFPELRSAYLEAETLYGRAIMQFGVPYKAVFDKDTVIDEMRSQFSPTPALEDTSALLSQGFAFAT